MAAKVKYDLYFDSSVGANDTDLQTSAIIPAGKTVRILNFGGFDPLIGDGRHAIIALQWGNGTGWKTIRAGGGGVFDFNLAKDFVGNGANRFRLARSNKSASAKVLLCWLYAVIL